MCWQGKREEAETGEGKKGVEENKGLWMVLWDADRAARNAVSIASGKGKARALGEGGDDKVEEVMG